ncbi:hypothetical protein OPT61_g464 [Boeremia exigua]|uniref:Uncharacterized protein n=1 Tax=Boeremia exigua TaxID=749465 RepID=A0ACC2IU13_9PLEO|nr:hypothetical protein OPT61_g464 [Boeremia exigua]
MSIAKTAAVHLAKVSTQSRKKTLAILRLLSSNKNDEFDYLRKFAAELIATLGCSEFVSPGLAPFREAEELLSFPTPNYVDPTTRRPLAISIITPMTVLVVAFISCRFYSRTILTKTLGWDDGIMLLAAQQCHGPRIDVATVPDGLSSLGRAPRDPLCLHEGCSSTYLETSEMYLAQSKSDGNGDTTVVYSNHNTDEGCDTVDLHPPASTYWNIFKYIGRTKCLNIKAIYYFHSAQNTLSDFLIFLWPARDLLNVKVSLRQRVTLTCMFSLGVIVCVAGVTRLYYTHVYLHSYDVFWHGAENFIIMCVESGVGIVCGCLPGCKPMMNRLFPRYFASTNNSSDQYPRRWQHNRSKQIDDEELTSPSASVRSTPIPLASPKPIHPGRIMKPAVAQQSVSRQTQQSLVPSSRSQPSLHTRSGSHTTTRTVNAGSMRTPNVHRSPSHLTQSTFTTTITAQPRHSRSQSRQSSKWSSVDLNKPLPMRPAPPVVAARRPNGSGFRRSRNSSKELSAISNASTEMFILQGRENVSGKQSPGRKNEMWMG